MTAAFLTDFDLDGVRVCAVPDQLGQGDNCRWPDGRITYAVRQNIPGVPLEQFEATLDSVFAHIAEHCGIDPVRVQQVRDARIAPGTEKIDGPSGVLAWSELPCGNKVQCLQAYDGSEKWSIANQDGKIWLWMVVLHEVLHALGLPHAPSGTVAVIAPTYNPRLTGLQPYDVQQLQRRYGPPKAKPTPTAPTTPEGGSTMGNLLKTLLLNAAKSWLDSAIKDGTLQRWLEEILTKLTSQQITNSEQLTEYVAEKLTAS